MTVETPHIFSQYLKAAKLLSITSFDIFLITIGNLCNFKSLKNEPEFCLSYIHGIMHGLFVKPF